MSDTPPVIVPPMLYVPVEDDQSQSAVVRVLADGRSGLLVYTALDRLADKCGPNQAWVLVATADLGIIKEVQSFDVIAFDIEVPAHMRAHGRIA